MSEILSIADERELRRRFLFRPCESKQELHDWVLTFIGLDFPDCIVDPDSNSSPMDMIYEVYSKSLQGDDENFTRVLYYACRDGFKTLAAAVVEVLSVLHLNRNVAHMAAISDQASKAQEYVKRAFRRPYIRDFVVGDNERMTKLVRFYNPTTKHSLTKDEYEALTQGEKAQHEEVVRVLQAYVEKEQYIKIVICTMAGANSEHVPLFVVDEVDVVTNPTAYLEAQNIPAGRKGKLPITMLTSTRKSAHSLVQKEINEKEKTGLQVRHWNIIDITAPCPPERHRPDLPRLKLYRSKEELRHVDEAGYEALNFKEKESFVEDTGFNGCGKCKLFTVCQTRLATSQTSRSPMLKAIPETIDKFKRNSIEMAQAQLMCWKPSSTGLVYGRFDRTKHILSPAQAYFKVFGELPKDPKNFSKAMLMAAISEREVERYGGLDWGHTHNFAYIDSFKDGQRLFVTHCVSMKELEPDQILDVMEPFKAHDPKIYADTADPKMVKWFKKKGWRMATWKKLKGSVQGGINVVRWKFSPPMGAPPELFFVHDLEEDPGMDILITRIAEYHWLNDSAGRPTAEPDKVDDDEADALRYLVMNVFDPKGKLAVASDTLDEDAVEVHPMDATNGYTTQNWMHKIIAERTGRAYEPAPQPTRPRMTVETPAGSSYYSDTPEKAGKSTKSDAPAPKGRKGGLIWDM